jgi:hypothetical protein
MQLLLVKYALKKSPLLPQCQQPAVSFFLLLDLHNLSSHVHPIISKTNLQPMPYSLCLMAPQTFPGWHTRRNSRFPPGLCPRPALILPPYTRNSRGVFFTCPPIELTSGCASTDSFFFPSGLFSTHCCNSASTSASPLPSFIPSTAMRLSSLKSAYTCSGRGRLWYTLEASCEPLPSLCALCIVRLNRGSRFTRLPVRELFLRA